MLAPRPPPHQQGESQHSVTNQLMGWGHTPECHQSPGILHRNPEISCHQRDVCPREIISRTCFVIPPGLGTEPGDEERSKGSPAPAGQPRASSCHSPLSSPCLLSRWSPESFPHRVRAWALPSAQHPQAGPGRWQPLSWVLPSALSMFSVTVKTQ